MEGGEGNRVGWTEDGEVGACFDGEESGKKMKGGMGEMGNGDIWLVGEQRSGAGWLEDDGVEEGVTQEKR